jgi:hypothetical protein
VLVWRYLDASEGEVGKSEPFADRDTAESWLTQEWEALRDRGVEEVMLIDEDGGEQLYTMGLGPTQDGGD